MNDNQQSASVNSITRQSVTLPPLNSGRQHQLSIYRFGAPGARPTYYLQAGLHADEFPGMLVLHYLNAMLEEAAQRGRIIGEVVILPQANPIGLEQHASGFLLGRHDGETGSNFNRYYFDLTAALSDRLFGRLTDDAQTNSAVIRSAMMEVLAEQQPYGALAVLRHTLLSLACDADLVFDLHADNQALPHMYVGTPLWPDAQDLAAELAMRAVLLAEKSGGNPFDEACSAPWWELARLYPDNPIQPACLATTLELGSNDDVDVRDAQDQAAALYRILERRGVIDGPTESELPRLRCEATPLTAMSQIKAPQAGLIAYRLRLGDSVKQGDVVATIIVPGGEEVDVLAETDGILFARHSQPYAWEGKIIGKIAGTQPLAYRQGDLLTD